MKIIFDNIIYALQKSGGGSVYWTELIKRFNKSNEIETVFYDQKEPVDNIFRKNLVLNNLLKENFFILKIRRYLDFTVAIKEKSIFHSSYFRISRSKNAINVVTIHDFTTEKFRKGIARWVNLSQKKRAVRYADGIICISENTKNDLLQYIPNVDPKKIRVIYNGVSDDFYKFDDGFLINEVDERFQGLQNYKYLLYIGHRTSYKNFDLAVKAMSKFKDQYKLVIIGENLTIEEQSMVDHYLNDSYIQIAKLNNIGLNYLYNKAFALLYPSSYEGFGIPIVEAMKTNCPVIASNNSSIPEVAGDAAILLNVMTVDSICEAIKSLSNDSLREQLTHKGLERSVIFNWDITCQKYIDFYKELYHEQ